MATRRPGLSPDQRSDERSGPGDPVVQVRGLGKTYEPTPLWMRFLVRSTIREPVVALRDVDLEVPAGGICAIVGPNGAGKSTLFRILVGLTTASTGQGTVAGFDVHGQSVHVRRRVGWMPAEERSLFMRLSARENLRFHGRMHGLAPADLERRIDDALGHVGLSTQGSRAGFALSSGMRARLQLARALLCEPELLILDEPTGTVDPVGSHELLELITGVVQERGIAALLSSHRLEEIEALQSNVLLLDGGQVRYQGDLERLRRSWDRRIVEIEFASPDPARTASGLVADVANTEIADGRVLRCRVPADKPVGDLLWRLGALTADIARVREVPMPLRDLLAEMYRRPHGEDQT